jgi:predicted ferric reductase
VKTPFTFKPWLLAAAYAVLILAPATVAMLSGQWADGERPVYQLGRCCALTAFTILCLQVFLTGRYKVVERHFGLDVLARFHRRMAMVAGVLILFHPVLLALGGLGARLLLSLDVPWYIWAAKATGVFLGLNLAVSLLQTRLSLGFERWRLMHGILAPCIVALAFTHSWFVKHGFQGTALASAWPVLAAGALALMAWHRIVRPRLAARHPYTVSNVRQEAPGVWTLELTPPPGPPGSREQQAYDYLPGQFHFLTLKRAPGLPVEEHHFTISSSPARRDFVSSTIKESGDFTATIGRTAPGDTAVVQGPFGHFSYLLHPEDSDMVFLAGGIGITPLMSMLRHMRDTASDKAVTFLYANRTEADIVFRGELAAMEAGGHPRLTVKHILSRPGPGWEGESGHLDADMLLRLCGGSLAGKAFYLSGPPGFVAGTLEVLGRLGVSSGRIRREAFSLLD